MRRVIAGGMVLSVLTRCASCWYYIRHVLVLHQTKPYGVAVFLVVSSGLLVKLSLIGFGKIQQLLGLQF